MHIADPTAPARVPGHLSPAQDLRRAFVLLALWTLYAIWQQWGHWGEDLSALYIAGHLWHSGQSDLLYAAPPGFFGGNADSWMPVMQDLGIADQVVFPYVYPPLWAVLIAPLTTVLGPQGFADAVTLIQVPLLAGSVLLAARLVKPSWMSMQLWVVIGITGLMVSIQSYLALWHNQPTITVTFLILLAFVCLGKERPVAAGAALALAAAIKLTPAAFALIFLIDRQYRALAAFALIGGALGLLSIALAGWPAHQAFLESLATVKGVALLSAVNTSLLTAVLAAGSALGALPQPPTDLPLVIYHDVVPVWLSPAISAAALGLAAAFARALLPLPGHLRRGIGLFSIAIIIALMGPLGWLHYYVLPMLLMPGLLRLLPLRPALGLIAVVALPSLTFVFGQIGALPWPIATYTWIMCAAWAAVLAGLYAGAARARARA